MRVQLWGLIGLVACGTPAKEECPTPFDAWADADGDGAGDPENKSSVCALGDGQVTNSDDCDDTNEAISPFSAETCDGIDEDCDGTPDDGLFGGTWYADDDGDTYGDPASPVQACSQPAHTSTDSSDCDDAHADAFPDASEACDGYDNDCDTLVDDDDSDVDLSSGTFFYRDQDSDGFGDEATGAQLCENPNPAAFSDVGGDCDDAQPSVNPNANEVCDLLDNNCDGLVDEDDPLLDLATTTTFYEDLDLDGAGNDAVIVQACFLAPGLSTVGGDCDDTEPLLQDAAYWVFDGDGDGVGAGATVGAPSCLQPQLGTVPQPPVDDCNDADATIYPGATDICEDGIDQDCTGTDLLCGPIGSFHVADGPSWMGNPPVYACIDACALLFGGVAADYHCSTSAAVLTYTNYVSGWADPQYCTSPVAEDYSKEQGGMPGYDCGAFACAYSAFVL